MTFRQPFRGSWPISQRYGEKITDPKGHTGIDYACPEGTEILASADGTVMRSAYTATGYGVYVILKHENGIGTVYAHLKASMVLVGDEVKQGDVIGLSGNTGNSTGPHLHFEARSVWNDYTKHFDPMQLPLISVDDSITQPKPQPKPQPKRLKEADELGERVQVVAPAGAWAWSQDFGKRETVYLNGQKLRFTGKTTPRNGYTYCEVYPEPVKYWVAVHDHDCQILDEAK